MCPHYLRGTSTSLARKCFSTIGVSQRQWDSQTSISEKQTIYEQVRRSIRRAEPMQHSGGASYRFSTHRAELGGLRIWRVSSSVPVACLSDQNMAEISRAVLAAVGRESDSSGENKRYRTRLSWTAARSVTVFLKQVDVLSEEKGSGLGEE